MLLKSTLARLEFSSLACDASRLALSYASFVRGMEFYLCSHYSLQEVTNSIWRPFCNSSIYVLLKNEKKVPLTPIQH